MQSGKSCFLSFLYCRDYESYDMPLKHGKLDQSYQLTILDSKK